MAMELLDLERREALLDEWVRTRREIAKLEARLAGLAAERMRMLDEDIRENPAHRDSIYRSMVAEYSAAGRVSKGAIEYAFLDAATIMDELPAVRAAFEEGRIDAAHAREIARALSPITAAIRAGQADPDVIDLYQAAVLVVAETDSPMRTRAHARQVAAALAGQSVTERHRNAKAERAVTVRSVGDGLALLTAILPEYLAVAIHDRLTRIAQEADREPDIDAILLAIRLAEAEHRAHTDAAQDEPEPVITDDDEFEAAAGRAEAEAPEADAETDNTDARDAETPDVEAGVTDPASTGVVPADVTDRDPDTTAPGSTAADAGHPASTGDTDITADTSRDTTGGEAGDPADAIFGDGDTFTTDPFPPPPPGYGEFSDRGSPPGEGSAGEDPWEWMNDPEVAGILARVRADAGEHPDVIHFSADTRTLDQMRADLLTDLLLTTDPSTVHGPALGNITARIQITVNATTLTGADDHPASLDGHGPLDPDIARHLAGNHTGWTRLFLDPTGLVTSTDTYTPTEPMRRFLRARDQHCRFPGCRMPVYRCQIDHNHDHALGGPTATDNLSHLCLTHHALKHPDVPDAHRWTARQTADGSIHWTSPLGRHYTDHPTRRVMFIPTPE
ncbi:DUF222 domain-containing protein [Microbacterium sp.]|uniref:DUF222 domain-containing protein n=1 Tax=Microbacterium sp. TaxID=51671 RepID=UPI002810AE5D|nr:DUF222 domain-containing protein [Microbacterium sp.]